MVVDECYSQSSHMKELSYAQQNSFACSPSTNKTQELKESSHIREQSYAQQNSFARYLSTNKTRELKKSIDERLTGKLNLSTKIPDNEPIVEHDMRRQSLIGEPTYESQQLIILSHFMNMTQKTQRLIQIWDRRMGLKRSHSSTMTRSMKSREMISKMILIPCGLRIAPKPKRVYKTTKKTKRAFRLASRQLKG
uniref:Uncharacterized protein n=1 Tax=Ditylum brightwellii TaxID=49249 RepID=A0A7S4SQ87_9STRA